MPRPKNNEQYHISWCVFTTLFKNAMSEKVLAGKVLEFKSFLVTPLTFLGTHLLVPWRTLFTPFLYWFVLFLGPFVGIYKVVRC
jgi:hypothetical protein